MPTMQLPPYSLILFLSAAINIGLGLYGLKDRDQKVYLYFGISFLLAGMWPLLYSIEMLFADRQILQIIAKYKALPMQLFSVFFLCFIFQFVKQTMPPKWLIAIASALAIAIIASMITNDSYHQAWEREIFVTTKEGFNLLVLVPGLWVKYTTVIYHYGVDFIALVLLFKGVITHKQPYKTQFQLISASIIITMLVSTAYIFQLASFGPYNPIPAIFAFTSTIVAVAVFRYKLLDVIPYARESVFEIIDAPVLIIDNNNTLVDYNSAANNMFKFYNKMIGKDIKEAFNYMHLDWDDLVENEHIILQTKWGAGSNYKLSVLKKRVEQQDIEGYLVIFNDITEQVDAINTAHEKEIITYKESILGDMHDGIGGVVATGTILAHAALSDKNIDEKNVKISQIARLLENGSFELRSMLNILDKKNIDWESLVADMRGFSSTVLDSKEIRRIFKVNGDIFSTDINFDKYLSIFRLFKETITNIVKHSEAENVTIQLTFNDESFKIFVSDDGKGLSDSSLQGFGLNNMQKRTEKLGGKLEITSRNGTNVHIYIPINNNVI